MQESLLKISKEVRQPRECRGGCSVMPREISRPATGVPGLTATTRPSATALWPSTVVPIT
jgi:hypothetical protein